MLTWLRKNTKSIMIVVVVLFVGSMFYGLGYQGLKGGFGGDQSKTIAKVNGREIDPARYREILNRIAQGFGANINSADMAFLDNLALGQAVDFYLLLNEANRKVRVSGKEIDASLDNIMNQQKIPSKRVLEEALQRMGMSLGKFRDLIRDDIAVQKLQMKLIQEIKVTPDDLREVRASHILVSKEALAKTLLKQLSSGDDFAALAKKYSLDPGSAAKGGDLGYFTTGMMVEPFEKAAFNLKPGKVSGLIKTPFGFHIIKLTDSRLRKIDDQTALREKQDKSFRRWFSEIKSKAKVEVLNPVMRGHQLRFNGRPAQAVAEYQKALRANPNNSAVHIYLGDTYLALGQKSLALSEYENAVKTDSSNPSLYILLGKAYEGAGEMALAAEQFKKASLLAGDNKAAHEQLLKLFQDIKRPAEIAREKAELARLAKKEKFEKELTGGK